ncbi:MAG TPA: signal peptidase II [Verrucomicrobiales bacterium]|jgi:signal peptidase II|nr:signal peptidase II [Verrucomicrobiales bacterium]HIL68816.1 signal peptidase II [Verrucomicrobiota bacterium]
MTLDPQSDPGKQRDRILIGLATVILFFDQLTKHLIFKWLDYKETYVVIDGFYKFVHWHNTGAAWSLFRGRNEPLAIISIIAVALLCLNRRHFGSDRMWGQISLGLLFGGIFGNLIDRVRLGYVVDFIYFYLYPRQGGEIGFPAFNIADSAICIGVGLMFYNSWTVERDEI